MFELSTPWWELMARTTLVYGTLLVMVRISGKRTVGQFTPFDLLVVMLLSEAVSNALSGGDDSLLGGLLAAATLIGLNLLIGWLSALSPRMERFIEGRAVLLGRNGQIYEERLKQHRVGRADVTRALREADCPQGQMRCLFLESDGSISVLKKKES